MNSEPIRILRGDSRETLKTLPEKSVQMCVTSPPYWGLRDYGVAGQIGLERTLEGYIATMCQVFDEVWRVLRDDGTLWLNLGDSYAGSGRGPDTGSMLEGSRASQEECRRAAVKQRAMNRQPGDPHHTSGRRPPAGFKTKDMLGVPWRVAFALQARGWYLRQEIIWEKPNAMPENVRDRCTKSHEHIFLLTKSKRYFYDADAIKEPVSGGAHPRGAGVNPKAKVAGKNSRENQDRDPAHKKARKSRQNASFSAAVRGMVERRNKRSVWRVATAQFRGAHFATFPGELILPCILAGSRGGDVVLDPFGGSGTTGQVALERGRRAILCELNPEYCDLIESRTAINLGMAI